MADGSLRTRDAEPAIHRLRAASWTGFEAVQVRTDPGLHHRPPQTVDRMGFHIGAPVRADCRLDGVARGGWQSRGDFDLVPAGADGAWEDDTFADILMIRFEPGLLADAAEGLGLDPARGRLSPRIRARDPHVELIVWALKAELDTDMPGPAIYGESLGAALAARLLGRHSGPATPRTGGLSPRQLNRVVELVEAGIDRELSLAELSRAAGVSVSHFTAMFRRAMGQSAHRYVVERRVLRAQALLAQGRTQITEVAAATGFAHPSHMARWMRRVSGVTPSAFARAT